MVDDGTASVQTEGGRRRWLRTPGMPNAKLDGLAGLRRARIRAHADIPPPRLDQHDHDLVQPLFRQQATGDPAPRRRGHRRPERRDEDLRLSRGAEEPVPTDWPGDTRDLVGDGLPAQTATQGQPLGAAPGGGASSGLRSRSWISRSRSSRWRAGVAPPVGLHYSAGTVSSVLAGIIGLLGLVVTVTVLVVQQVTGTLSPRSMRL
jgi:hypothetical protein